MVAIGAELVLRETPEVRAEQILNDGSKSRPRREIPQAAALRGGNVRRVSRGLGFSALLQRMLQRDEVVWIMTPFRSRNRRRNQHCESDVAVRH